MWGGTTQPDPGGENLSEAPASNQELKDLKDQFDQQLVLIAQLKEMLRKSEQTAVMQEKVEEYANTLTRMNARVKKSKSKRDADVIDGSSINIDTPASEKILLLRQQMEANKLKLAERGKLHRGIEETVTQMKAQLDDSQHLISQASINLSLIDPKEENYSITSSQEELFNFLVNKDRRINELNIKIQKLEASVLDLQENVKEKDSVIDARTKAITLMTESLSKKGKSTLDALDDTKEQMRKMQENFINFEAQMNNEKQFLTDQLDAKNIETQRLEKLCNELNQELDQFKNEVSPKKGKKGKKTPKTQKSSDESNFEQNECEVHLAKITEHEGTINELNLTIEELKAVQTKTKESEQSENIDMSKLKRQLDENNKSMIKIKAQHKSKVKELNKTIDELKKDRDGTMEIKRLQEENAKLNEQVSKLTSNNDLAASEHVNDLEMKQLEHSALVESKNQAISTLEEQIIVYKTQVEQLEKFSRLENDQVVSEIMSIDFEEQLDKVQMEKTNLQHKYDEIVAEKATLLEAIDNLGKEKQEISLKLDSYIQENMELIDKLEKLNSAKVSSAESIEIVEGLTQQEKLELEEYQKDLEIPENIKNSVENLESPGLNETVNQLTEETSDLLRKIELFTEERREVMDKMDALAVENAHLNMKICEVENNRDVLAETYEQVQNEKEDLEAKLEIEKQKAKELENNLLEKITILQDENKTLQEEIDRNLETTKHNDANNELIKKETIESLTSSPDLQSQINEYKALIEIQKQEIQELKLELLSQQNLSVAHSDLQEEINSLQTRYQALLLENESLAQNVKDKSEIIHEKDKLEAELVSARKKINEFSEKLNENLEEIENYKSIVSENKNELISSANTISDLQNKVHVKQNEIQYCEAETERLNLIIADLSDRISIIESESARNVQNIETVEIMSNQLQELKEILNENIKQIEIYEGEIQTNSNTIDQLTLQLKEVKIKLDNMEEDLETKNNAIVKLHEEQSSRDLLITKLHSELKEKDQNFDEACEKLKEKCLALQSKIDENTGSLDRLDLPKMQELELKNKDQLEKMKKIAASLKKKNTAYQELDQRYKELDNNYKVLNSDVIIKTKEIEQLKVQNSNLQKLSEEAELHRSNECNDLNAEINIKNDLIQTLTTDLEDLRYSSETNSNALHVKIQELEMYIETQDVELNRYKEQVNRLEEGLSALEERRQSLERQAIELGNQLQEKSNSYEEISQIEDILEQRLAILLAQDKKMEKRLRDTTVENQKLQENNKYLLEENDQIKQKLVILIERNADADKVVYLEREITYLKEFINKIEGEFKHHCAEYEKKLIDKSTEVENMEVELQEQLMQLNTERKALTIQCEQLNDEIREHLETEEVLRESIDDCKMKLTQQQTDFDLHIAKFQEVSEENKKNMNIIDQLHIQASCHTNEMENLNKSLSEKDAEIENCRLQSEQLVLSNQKLQEQYDAMDKQLSELNVVNSELLDKVAQFKLDGATIHSLPASTSEPTIATFVWPDQTSNDPFDSIVSSHPHQNIPNQSLQINESKITSYFDTSFIQHNEPKLFHNVESQTVPSDELQLFNNTYTQTNQIMSHTVETTTEQETETNIDTEPVSQRSSEPLLQTQPLNDCATEELFNKIKTLEFMLFNVEKEKEDALSQCQELTSQIAHLIYEKQICSPDETVLTTEDCKQLQKLEFTSVNDNTNENEEIMQSKQAYLCYKMDTPTTDIDTQIVSADDAQTMQNDLQQLQCIEFGKYEPNKPNEDICEAKSTYLCYPVDTDSMELLDIAASKENLQKHQNVEFIKCEELKDVAPLSSTSSEIGTSKTVYLGLKPDDIFDENDDGWGCGSDEAKLEADYHHQQQVDQNITYISELNEIIHNLELECQKYREENKQSQIKSGKLLKKLKEYKILNDKLETDLRKSGEFTGLDDALQDEFKAQIAQLEKRFKEVTLDLEKERSYKNNLLKQLDVLQAANERMVDMKEKQDFELLTWQRQNRELSSKLEQLEWGEGDSESPKHERQQPSNDKINELTAVIDELTKDNDDLQILLEEQRNLRIAAEKTKIESVREEDYLSIVADKNSLKDELMTNLEEKKALQDQLNNLIKLDCETQEKLATVDKEKLTLENQLFDKSKTVTQLTNELDEMKIKVSERENDISLQTTIEELRTENLYLHKNKASLEEQIKKINEENKTSLEEQIKKLNEENKAKLENQLKKLNEENKTSLEEQITKFNEVEKQLASYEQQVIEMTNHLHLKTNELLEMTNKFETVVNEKSSLASSIQLLNDEWSQKVDQRGSDIAESWKLHLETRESEFSQFEHALKKEINELEERCNALVNENNELRKNVDTEIRNEVDKISALQQHITDRQLCINDLSRTIQETQTELEQQRVKIKEHESLIQQINEENASLKLQITEKLQTVVELENKMISFSDLQKETSNKDELIRTLQSDLVSKQTLIEENLLNLNQLNIELNEYKETVDRFIQQVESKDDYISELAQSVHENQTQVNLLNKELMNKTNSIEKLEAALQDQPEINNTILELNKLKIFLQEREKEFEANILEKEKLLNATIQEFEIIKNSESSYKEMLSVKDSDLENVKLELFSITQNYNSLADDHHKLEMTINDLTLKLNDKIFECEELHKKMYEQDLLYSEENQQISELSTIIEDQVLRIEAQKQELYEKSKDYDSLIAELDIRKPSLVEHMPLAPELLKESQIQQSTAVPLRSNISSSNNSLEPISKAELDLALYMLHQRDVRCEELTIELMQLLEERDTLQLKLSNAIREREEFRKKCLSSDLQTQRTDTETNEVSTIPSSPSKVSAIVLGASGTEIATEAIESSQMDTGPLANKLLELKTVGYRRDKTLLDEQEQRRIQQLALMQDHRDIASLLPPEAAAKLVQDASYTLSRDVQSPSKVLLDWLWGKSTPKVNNV